MAESFEWPAEAVETAVGVLAGAYGYDWPIDADRRGVQAVLAAVAPIAQARMAEAWDEGWRAAHDRARSDLSKRIKAPNPYRAAEIEGGA
jgi:hypothetical protein